MGGGEEQGVIWLNLQHYRISHVALSKQKAVRCEYREIVKRIRGCGRCGEFVIWHQLPFRRVRSRDRRH